MNHAATIIRCLLEQDDDADYETDLAKDVSRPLTSQEIASYEKEQLRDKILTGKYRESQYVDAYLSNNDTLGEGKGHTLSTFLAYQLRGAAKDYASRYKNALQTALERRVQAGLAAKGRSRLGGTAYYSLKPD